MSTAAPTLRLLPAEAPVSQCIAHARAAQARWASLPVAARLRVLRRARQILAVDPHALLNGIPADRPHAHAEILASEIIPLADAIKFLEKNARRILQPQRLGRRGRPGWLRGTATTIQRDPLGVVLVIAPGNYPAFLPGVHAAHALAAGNAVLLKPAPGTGATAQALASLFTRAGLDPDLIRVLPDTVEAAQSATAAGVDHVVLTGSAETGRTVMRDLATWCTPSTMELSGCDAVFVRRDADLDLVAQALRFGLAFNGSRTCIAPRRAFVPHERMDALIDRLTTSLRDADPVSLPQGTRNRLRGLVASAQAGGARLVVGQTPDADTMTPIVLAGVDPAMGIARSDVFAPVLSLIAVENDNDALDLATRCPYALGASVFGSAPASEALAARIDAGVVLVNDMIAPTADPRVPFGGRRDSGFGVTRGAEGLLALTAPKTVITRRGGAPTHLQPLAGGEDGLFLAWLRAAHASGPVQRIRGFLALCREGARLARRKKEEE